MHAILTKGIPQLYVSLTISRIVIKGVIVIAAILLHADYNAVIILIGLCFISEIYKNAAYLLIKQYNNMSGIGAIISAIDGAVLVFALYFANSLSNDMYLFVIFSIILNTIEYGLLSAVVEGIVASFSYAIFTLFLINFDQSVFFSFYLLRICFLLFLGWVVGWISSQLREKENTLQIVLENDIHEEALNEVKDTFVSDAAETLKTPIAAIKGYIDILVNGRLGQLDDRVKEYLQNISRNIQKIDSQTEELLHIIQIEDDAIKLKKKPMHIEEFMSILTEDAKAYAKIYKNKLHIKQEVNASVSIAIDAYRLKIAIKSMLYYLFESAAEDILMHVYMDTEQLYIAIITKITDIDLFSVFTQSEEETHTHMSGSMIKVYTARLIVESHQGTITIQKGDENEITFIISIPITE